MSNTIGHVKELDASRTEVLQGLLRSLGHTDDDPSSDPTEQVQKLSKKIKEILGDDENPGQTSGDASSQLLNEDGLPIVDISEPVDENVQTSASSPPVPEQDLIPLSLLPPEVRERRRRDRDRILDLLEEEERLQQLQEERDAEEERQEAIRKRKESAKAELEQLKVARELQKRMGQALVQHVKGVAENHDGQKDDARSKPKTVASDTKKKVSFADAPEVERDQETSIDRFDWGDVTPARLRAQTRVPLVSKAEAQKYPMKLRVVERCPTASPMSSFHDDADSDDESASSTGHRSPRLENGSLGEEDEHSSSDNKGSSDDEVLEEEFDCNTAQHHREIALEYYKKRHAIGAETAKAMHAHSLDDDDQQGSPQSNGQLPLSRFRADRMATAYDQSHSSVSTSIGQTVIPVSRQKSLRNSVRLGKLEGDNLAGGESGESGSEDETVREVIQMLRTGNLQNVGPDFNTSSNSAPPRNSLVAESPSVGTTTTARETKPSRFKVARGGGTQETPTSQGNNGRHTQSQPAISSVIERKVPRSLPNQRFPVNKPPPRSAVKSSEQGHTMIIDSPSFPMLSASSTSPAHPVTTGSLSPHQTQPERPSLVLSNSSTTDDSMIQSQDPLSVERPVSKFMAERRK